MRKYLEVWFNNKVSIVSIALFFATLTILSLNLNKPFYGEHDWNGARYGNIARNYLKYDLIQTKLGQVENSGYVSSDPPQYFTHYPPVLTLLIALSYKAFGIFEWSTRLVPVLATASSIVLIFLIGNKIATFEVGLLAAVLVLVTPLVLYFGKTPVQEPLVVFFVLMAYFSYLNLNSKPKIFKHLFVTSLILAQLTTWVGFFLIPAMILTAVVKKDSMEVKSLSKYLIISLVVFLIYISLVYLQTGSPIGGDLFGVLLQRSGLSSSGQIDHFNFFSYLLRLRLWISTLYTLTLTILVGYWLIVRLKLRKNQSDWAIVTLGIFGAIYFIFFPNAAYIHSYLIFYLLPFMALAAASGLVSLAKTKLFQRYNLILYLLVISLVTLERIDYLKALNFSNADSLAVEVGKAIHSQTKVKDIILIAPAEFGDSGDNFLKFYADRKIIYAAKTVVPSIWVNVNQTSRSFLVEKKD